jgi:hypothetical protein
MKTVIDVGCARYGGDFSIERLIEEFHPDRLLGFDPNWEPDMFTPSEDLQTTVICQDAAAWTFDGKIGFRSEGLNSCLSWTGSEVTSCLDLARVIRELPDDDEIILKIDAEGSEYELLEHLINKGADERLSLAWVEWHPFGVPNTEEHRSSLEQRLRCPVDEWRW